MSIEEKVLEKLRELPAEKQKEVLEFVELLLNGAEQVVERKSLRGLWAGYDIDITEEDIAEMRREAWKNFPREFPVE